MNADPTTLELMNKIFREKKEKLAASKSNKILEKYGGAEHMEAPPKELLLAQTESYVEYDRSGAVVAGQEKAIAKSKYVEDILTHNHTAVWGSFFDRATFRWGYADDHSMRNSYSTGAAGLRARRRRRRADGGQRADSRSRRRRRRWRRRRRAAAAAAQTRARRRRRSGCTDWPRIWASTRSTRRVSGDRARESAAPRSSATTLACSLAAGRRHGRRGDGATTAGRADDPMANYQDEANERLRTRAANATELDGPRTLGIR